MNEPSAATPSTSALSVLLVATHGWEPLRETVAAWRAQTIRERLELLLVVPGSDELAYDPEATAGFANVQVVPCGPMRFLGQAHAAGVRAASAPFIVLAEDHSRPEPDSAAALLAAHEGPGAPWAGVGPAVANGNPRNAVSRTDFLFAFGAWPPTRPAGETDHLPGHNSCYRRDALLAFEEAELPVLMETGMNLHHALRARGGRLRFEPRARVMHDNFAGWGVHLSVRFHGARVFGAGRSAGWPWWRRAVYVLGSPLIPLVRARQIVQQAWLGRVPARWWPGIGLVLPLAVLVLGWGEMLGYLTGTAGASEKQWLDFEERRSRFV